MLFKTRGKYNLLTSEQKLAIINICKTRDISFIKKVSKMFNIDSKNIFRWIENGPNRKIGCGRKSNNI